MADLDMTYTGFNLGAFNLMPFNLIGESPEDVALALDSAIALDGAASAGPVYEESGMLAETGLAHAAALWFAAAEDMTSLMQLCADARGNINYYSIVVAEASLQGGIALSCNTNLPPAYCATQMAASAAVSLNTVLSGMLGAIALDSWVRHARFEVVEIRVDYELSPGQTIVIDASDFTVKMDGFDILDKHTGAWPIIDDNTYDISYGSPSGTVKVDSSAGWTERYL